MLSILLLMTLVTAVSDAKSDTQTPRQIVERAIEAQGGEEQVAKLIKPWRAKVKGKAGLLFGGMKMATRFTKYKNHKLTSVEEIVDLTFVDRIDDREFERPR